MSLKTSLIFVSFITILGIAGRLLPHLPNVTFITALALFMSAYIGVKYSAPVIMIIMLVSDIFIGFYSWPIMLTVYGSFLVAGVLGYFLQNNKTVLSILTVTLGSSILFFLTTNWAVWQFGTMYEHSMSGLIQSYAMAIPFFKNSLLGDLVYTSMFFGAYELARYGIVHRNKLLGLFSAKKI